MIGGTIMAHLSQAPASQEAEAQPPFSAGYLLLPRQLRQDCRQVGINTLKLVLFVAVATLGWDFNRWAALTYRVLVAEAGIPNDAGVRRAIEEAQARSALPHKPCRLICSGRIAPKQRMERWLLCPRGGVDEPCRLAASLARPVGRTDHHWG
jgi:hypothetical protein